MSLHIRTCIVVFSTSLSHLDKSPCHIFSNNTPADVGFNLHIIFGAYIQIRTYTDAHMHTHRSLLTPQPMKEMRVKTPYVHHKDIKGAIGVKICANGIERALAGSNLMVLGPDDDENELRDEVMKDLGGILKKVKKNEDGVYVQASTLGSLEALLEFLEVTQTCFHMMLSFMHVISDSCLHIRCQAKPINNSTQPNDAPAFVYISSPETSQHIPIVQCHTHT
jgi:hypothetical protein